MVMAVSITRARNFSHNEGSGLALATEGDYENNYVLPYPGVLPGHPLYNLKMIRDRVREWMAMSAEEKAGLYLELANKRIAATKTLIETGEQQQGVVTAEKGLIYQSKAVNALTEMKLQAKEVGKVGNELELAIDKHSQVLLELMEKMNEPGKSTVVGLLSKMDTNYGMVAELLGR